MREIIKRQRVLMSEPARPGRGGPGAEAEVEHARVARLLRVEGRVTAIELTCSCGSTSVVELQYEPEDPTPEATS